MKTNKSMLMKIFQVNQDKLSCITRLEIKVNLNPKVIQLKWIIINFYICFLQAVISSNFTEYSILVALYTKLSKYL